jgi:predicted aminopeptidase
MKLLSALALAATLTACASPAWYTQAAGGHMKLMHQREDIGDYLATAPQDDELAGRLRLVQVVLRFAQRELDLPADDSYQSLVRTGRNAVTWNVVATPELSLESKRWCHLVGGCLPYLGYFSQAAAEQHSQRLRARGMDTAVAGVTAYSTLGWFDDPVLDTMLTRSDAALASSLIHELAHQRLFVRGDADFSEAYATFMEHAGTRAWLAASGRDGQQQEWQQRLQASRQFNGLLMQARAELESIYAGTASDADKRQGKQQVFARLQQLHAQMVRESWGGRQWFSGWFEPPPNNADLALTGSYLGGQCAFQRLLDEHSGDFVRFQADLDTVARGSREQRAAWLAADC